MSAKQAELINEQEQEQDLEGEELCSEEVGDLAEGEGDSMSAADPWFWKGTATFFAMFRGDSMIFEQEYTFDSHLYNFKVEANLYGGIFISFEESGKMGDPFFTCKETPDKVPAFGSIESMLHALAKYRDRELIEKLWRGRPGVDRAKKEKRAGRKKAFSFDLE